MQDVRLLDIAVWYAPNNKQISITIADAVREIKNTKSPLIFFTWLWSQPAKFKLA